MAKETDANTGQSVPDTATTYERAKPEEESVDGTLSKQPTLPPQQEDQLARNAEPKSPKKAVAD